MIVFPIGASGQRLVFSSSVLKRFAKHRQLRWWHREAGGQLFARLALPEIHVEESTGPRRSDRRTRHSYWPNRPAEQREIANRHWHGLHFIGDWHTHPEAVPTLSRQDAATMCDLAVQSHHALNAFVLVIVGNDPFPRGLLVSLFDGAEVFPLSALDAVDGSSTGT
jgi:integrative and conjugative element protein (TIGR02256 family)